MHDGDIPRVMNSYNSHSRWGVFTLTVKSLFQIQTMNDNV